MDLDRYSLQPTDIPILEYCWEVLGDGPLSFAELYERCCADTDLERDAVDEEVDPVELLDDILIRTDYFWQTADGMVARIDRLLEGTVFTHRLGAGELEHQVVHTSPDLDSIGYDLDRDVPLAAGGTMRVRYDDDDPAIDEQGSFVGPPGWLAGFEPGDLVAFRRRDGRVSISKATDLATGDAEVKALTEAHAALADDPQMGVEPHQIVLEALAGRPGVFRTPVPAVDDLLASAGLERRGAFAGPAGGDWGPPGVIAMQRDREQLRRRWKLEACCDDALGEVIGAWQDFVLDHAVADRSVARALDHGMVAPAFCEWALGRFDETDTIARFASAIIDGGHRPLAPAYLVRAEHAERQGRVLEAEADLEAAVRADGDYLPALFHLAQYAFYRGDHRRAARLLRRAGAGADHPMVEFLDLLDAHTVTAGRNDPCPCGSGRKFKACCLNDAKVPPALRVQWLTRKLTDFVLRLGRDATVGLAMSAMRPDFEMEDLAEKMADPFIIDLATFEAGGVAALLDEREELLPADEVDLLELWMETDRLLWEIVELEPGVSLTLRDTTSGDVVTVDEHLGSQGHSPGEYMLARVVPAFGRDWIVGTPLSIDLRRRDSAMSMVDGHADADSWARWYAGATAPPAFVNREGHDMVLCEARLRPDDWAALEQLLDESFDPTEDGHWVVPIDIDGERVVRASLRRDDDELRVSTNSVERMDAVLADLAGCEVLERSESPLLGFPRFAEEGGEAPEVFEASQPSPEVMEMLEALITEKEDQWLDESIPALGGATPREAADDPTRRADLIALLDSMPILDRTGPGRGFDPVRLRRLLGLE